MRTRIGLGFAALFLATAACSNSIFVSPDAGDGDDGGVVPVHGGGDGDAGSDAASPVDAAPPPNCDTSKLPTDDACVVNDAEGIFVSSSMGSASGNGSKASPLASLDAAIAMAKTVNRRVYACAETYGEQIHILDGVSIFGYFACQSAWSVDTSKHAKVSAPASPAAIATNVTTPTRVEAVDLNAPDFTTNSQSSIALMAVGSPALTFKSATIHAGTGGAGANGTNGIQLTDTGSKNGTNARGFDVCTGAIGHCITPIPESIAGGANSCSGEAGHDPGPGGAGGWDGKFLSEFSQFNQAFEWFVNGQDATSGFPTIGTSQTTQGGVTSSSVPTNGAAGANGTDGASAGAFGTLGPNGYSAADGAAGSDGAPGQGGGGAAGQAITDTMAWAGLNVNQGKGARGEAGASGGAGGCPGLAATAGKGGGASIAVVAIGSAFTLDTIVIETSMGGAGGAAGVSSTNTTGGTGGSPVQYTVHAANGGDGGFAGVSGNGGGGPSIGIAYQGTAPTQLASTVKLGAPGSGRPASTDTGSGKTIPASANGVSASTYAF